MDLLELKYWHNWTEYFFLGNGHVILQQQELRLDAWNADEGYKAAVRLEYGLPWRLWILSAQCNSPCLHKPCHRLIRWRLPSWQARCMKVLARAVSCQPAPLRHAKCLNNEFGNKSSFEMIVSSLYLRSVMNIWIKRIANHKILRFLLQRFQKFIINPFLDEYTRASYTYFPLQLIIFINLLMLTNW